MFPTLCDYLRSGRLLAVPFLGRFRLNKFLISILIYKFPLTNMLLRSIRNPDLVLKFPSLLAGLVFVNACSVQAGVELAHDL